MNRTMRWTLGVLLLPAGTGWLLAGGPGEKEAPKPKIAEPAKPPAPEESGEECRAARRTLTPTVSFDGALVAADPVLLYVRPEAYDGSWRVTEFVPSGRSVKKGEILVRFDDHDYLEAVRASTEALATAGTREKFLREELALMPAQNQESMRALAEEKYHAERDLDIWTRDLANVALRESDLGLRGYEAYVSDQKEELEQLQSMYDKSELADETREIVLNRAKRGMEIALEGLDLTRIDTRVEKDYRHPDQTRDLKQALEHATEGVELEKRSADLAIRQKQHEIEQAAIEARNAREHHEKLARDKGGLAVLAPEDGVFVHDEIEIGSIFSKDQKLGRFLASGTLEVHAEVGPEGIRICVPGAKGVTTLRAWPERELDLKVLEVADAPAEGKDEAHYAVRLGGDLPAELRRFGMPCRTRIEGEPIRDALCVPVAAVHEEKGKCTVRVPTEAGEETRAVVCGFRDEDWIQIVKGLKEGEAVLTGEESEEGDAGESEEGGD